MKKIEELMALAQRMHLCGFCDSLCGYESATGKSIEHGKGPNTCIATGLTLRESVELKLGMRRPS